jgi:hypothetical protein
MTPPPSGIIARTTAIVPARIPAAIAPAQKFFDCMV